MTNTVLPRLLALGLVVLMSAVSLRVRADEQMPNPAWRCCATETCGTWLPTQQEAVTNYITTRIAYTPTGACGTNTSYRFCPVSAGHIDCPLVCPGNILSQDGTCPGPDTQKNNGPNNCTGNPINAANGNKFESATDYDQGLLVLRRSYNRFGIGSGAFGAKWDATYFTRIAHGVSRPDQTTVTRADGRRFVFTLSGVQWVPDADVADRLVQIKDGSGATTGWTYSVAADDSSETYDASGKLTQIRSRSGLIQTLSYSTSSTPLSIAPVPGLLIAVTGPFGHQLAFVYDASRRVKHVQDPAGGQYTYAYDPNNNLASIQYPDGALRTYRYNEVANTSGANLPNALTGIIDEDGQRFATYRYDTQGRAIRTEHGAGAERYDFSYGANNTSTVTDPLGTVRSYTFQLHQKVLKLGTLNQPCASGCGSTVSKARMYDVNGNVESSTDFNDNTTTYSYDLNRNLETSRTEAFGTPRARTITTQWHASFRLPTVITEPRKTTTFSHDTDGNVLTRTVTDTTVTPNVARTWTYTYNSLGQVLTANGPRTDVTDVTTYTYYNCTTGSQCGRVHTVTNALSQTTTYNSYDAHGLPLTIIDPNGVVTTLTYDSRQRLMSRTVGSEETAIEYWATGLRKKVTLADDSFVSYTYDPAHRLIEVQDSLGNRIAYTLDAMGNRTSQRAYDPSDTLTQKQSRVFDSLNRLQKQLTASGATAEQTVFGYDANGNQTTITAPLGRSSSSEYDELNRLTEVTDALSGVTEYGYDSGDNLTSVTDPRDLTTNYAYNGFGEVKALDSPDTGVTTYESDPAGNLTSRTDARSVATTYAYDALNRVTQETYPDRTVSYTYDQGANGLGRVSSISDPSGSTSWTHTPEGRVASRTQAMGSVTKSTTYTYNAAGQLETLTTPSGREIQYSYANNQIVGVRVDGVAIVEEVLYEPFGPLRGWTWGNGSLAERVHDADGNVTAIDSAGLATYDHDDAQRITGIEDDDDANRSWTYGYDLLDRLSSASRSGLTQTFGYDATGNRTSQGGTTISTHTIAATSNRLSSVSGALSRSYSYDAAGNTSSDGTATFTHDGSGRMVSATRSGTTTTYVHNALGQRVKKVNAGGTTYFVYDEAGHLLGEYDVAGDLIEEIVWMGDTPVATIRWSSCGVAIFYIHTDHLDTPRRITKRSSSTIVWRWDSDPFGTTAANEDPDGDSNLFVFNLRFPGQYFDVETGLHYNYYRDCYDPATGRYCQSDPIGLDGGLNTYAYVDADPVHFADPLGLAPGDVFGTREAAESDRAIFAALLDERRFAPDVILSRFGGSDPWDNGYLTGVYQIDGTDEASCWNAFTYDWIDYPEPLIGYPPGVGKKFGLKGGHRKARPSTKEKHERADTRRQRDYGGEKGDTRRRPPLQRPDNWKGPWPPK